MFARELADKLWNILLGSLYEEPDSKGELAACTEAVLQTFIKKVEGNGDASILVFIRFY